MGLLKKEMRKHISEEVLQIFLLDPYMEWPFFFFFGPEVDRCLIDFLISML